MEDRTKQADRASRTELVERIAAAGFEDGVTQPMPGLYLTRASRPSERLYGASKPSLCVIAQGAKEIYLGDRSYAYDEHHYLLTTLELPVTGRTVVASHERLYLALRLELNETLVRSVLAEARLPVPRGPTDARAIVVSDLDFGPLDSVVRLVQLIRAPDEALVLAPLVRREIVYRLLLGEHGHRLSHLKALTGNENCIAKAIEMLRKRLDRPLSIKELAQELGMSSSGFHHHFKSVTDMSPLQYQKQVRLQTARQLMVSEYLGAAAAGYRVGYGDPSHFSRDYNKQFGVSPVRDVGQLRGNTQAT